MIQLLINFKSSKRSFVLITFCSCSFVNQSSFKIQENSIFKQSNYEKKSRENGCG